GKPLPIRLFWRGFKRSSLNIFFQLTRIEAGKENNHPPPCRFAPQGATGAGDSRIGKVYMNPLFPKPCRMYDFSTFISSSERNIFFQLTRIETEGKQQSASLPI